MKKSLSRALAVAATVSVGTAVFFGTSTAAYAVAPDTWTITTLTLDNPVVIDGMDTSGDDGGFLGVTQDFMLRDGDTAGYSYDLADLTPAAATDFPAGDGVYNLVSDLKTNTSYQLVLTYDAGLDTHTATTLIELDQDGNSTTTEISLSTPIDVTNGSWLAISGFGYIALWNGSALTTNGGDLYVIAPDGTVTQHDTANGFDAFGPYPADHNEGSHLIGAGVGEFDGTDYWFVGTDSNGSISEFSITGTADQDELLDNVDAVSDSDTFMISTCADKWYIHSENDDGSDDWTSYFGQDITGMEEPMISADATFSSAGTCAPTPDPELPNTGVNAGAGIALAGLLTGLGAVAFIVVRRRQVASK